MKNCPIRFLTSFSFKITYEELKYRLPIHIKEVKPSFKITYEELKFRFMKLITLNSPCFKITYEELKFGFQKPNSR